VLRAPCFQGQQAWLREVRCPDAMTAHRPRPTHPAAALGPAQHTWRNKTPSSFRPVPAPAGVCWRGPARKPSRVRKFAPKYLGNPLNEISRIPWCNLCFQKLLSDRYGFLDAFLVYTGTIPVVTSCSKLLGPLKLSEHESTHVVPVDLLFLTALLFFKLRGRFRKVGVCEE
jgi:hypothetical protein